VVITEVRIKLMDVNHERLLGFCSVTFDDMFVIRDLKIIDGTRGAFVAMPSRKLTDRCPECGCKNHLRARFCNHCGLALDEDRAIRPIEGRAKLHADIAHPIHSQCRDAIQRAIMKAYQEECERAKRPGYVCRYDEIDAGDYEDVPLDPSPFGTHGPHVREFGAGIFDRT
jgi:stage V sporulation protein G